RGFGQGASADTIEADNGDISGDAAAHFLDALEYAQCQHVAADEYSIGFPMLAEKRAGGSDSLGVAICIGGRFDGDAGETLRCEGGDIAIAPFIKLARDAHRRADEGA